MCTAIRRNIELWLTICWIHNCRLDHGEKYISSSKHLKGRLGPHVGDGHIFWTKGGQLDLPVGDVTFFGSKEVSWIPLLVTSRFWDQRRSFGAPCWWCHTFWIKGGRLGPPVGDVTFLHQKVPDQTESWPDDPNLGLTGRRPALA